MSPSPQDPLRELLTRHKAFLAQAEACIEAGSSSVQNSQYREFLSLILDRIKAHKTSLQAVERNKHIPDDTVRWGPIQVTGEEQDGQETVLHIQGPASGDKHTITVESEAAAETISQALARASNQQLAIVKLRRTKPESRKAVDTDQTRIALLKQYNDLRDVAQQFIGIVADNRGVPVRSLYADGAYGVGPED